MRGAETMTGTDAAPSGEAVELRDYLHVLRRRGWTIAGVTVAAVALALLVGPLTDPGPRFRATATVLPGQSVLRPTDVRSNAQRSSAADLALIRSLTTATIAADRLSSGEAAEELLERVSVRAVPDTPLLYVSFIDGDPDAARQGADAFAEAYLEFRRRGLESDSRARLGRANDLIDGIAEQLRAATAQVAAAEEGSPERASAEALQQVLLSQLEQLESDVLQRQLEGEEQGVVLEPARPGIPVERPARTAAPIAAGFLGLLAGTILAFVRDRLDPHVHSPAEVERSLGAPVLAEVAAGPSTRWWGRRSDPASHPVVDVTAESFRRLRSALLSTGGRPGARTMVVAGATARAPRTHTAARLAVSVARANRKVALIAADSRAPRVGMLEDLLADAARTQPWAASDGPDVLLPGAVPGLSVVLLDEPLPDQAARLSQARLRPIVSELSRRHDLVLVETSPALEVADALETAPLTGGVILLVHPPSTTRAELEEFRRLVERAGSTVLGAVIETSQRVGRVERHGSAGGKRAEGVRAGSSPAEEDRTYALEA